MTIGLIGTKLGMTREFIQSGQSVPVTVIKVEKGRIIDIVNNENRGYSAIQIGYFKTKNSKLTIILASNSFFRGSKNLGSSPYLIVKPS